MSEFTNEAAGLSAAAKEGAILALREKLLPMVRALTRRLGDDDDGEFMIELLEAYNYVAMKRTSLFDSDEHLQNYFEKVMRNRFLKLIRAEKEVREMTMFLPDWNITDYRKDIAEKEVEIFISQVSENFTDIQKKVLIGKILEGKKDVELAKELGVTHQTVLEAKVAVFKKLRVLFLANGGE